MDTNIYVNRILHVFEVMRIRTKEKVVYLTFDDGPEDEIAEFVLGNLKKYDAKATFFCRGDNAQNHPDLLQKIIDEGHSIGNHTYSHLNSFYTPNNIYVSDVFKADSYLKSRLFRPPHGCIKLGAFLRLCRKFKIVYWSLLSGDAEKERMNLESTMNRLKSTTRKGDVVLFHFCKLHEKETRQILPLYLEWLFVNGYKCEKL